MTTGFSALVADQSTLWALCRDADAVQAVNLSVESACFVFTFDMTVPVASAFARSFLVLLKEKVCRSTSPDVSVACGLSHRTAKNGRCDDVSEILANIIAGAIPNPEDSTEARQELVGHFGSRSPGNRAAASSGAGALKRREAPSVVNFLHFKKKKKKKNDTCLGHVDLISAIEVASSFDKVSVSQFVC